MNLNYFPTCSYNESRKVSNRNSSALLAVTKEEGSRRVCTEPAESPKKSVVPSADQDIVVNALDPLADPFVAVESSLREKEAQGSEDERAKFHTNKRPPEESAAKTPGCPGDQCTAEM
jgi:hypothetical protein